MGDSANAGEQWGLLPDGRPVSRYRLGDPDGLWMHVLDLGCVVQELWVPDLAGRQANVVLGCPTVEGYLRAPAGYFGAVVGRFANRIAGGTLRLDGRTYSLLPSEGGHTLHGGPEGFHRRLWNVEHADRTQLVLSLVSPDGDQGFPGELRAQVSYRVDEDEVRVDYRAESDAPTVVNLTQHAHFRLAGEGGGSVEDHLLSVAAGRFTPVDDDMIPTGDLVEVAGTVMDLRVPRPIGAELRSGEQQLRRGRGYDHNFVLDGLDDGPAARLSDPQSGRVLEVYTDQPGLQVYTCNVMDGSHVGTGGRTYRQGDGVALETQHFPDSPHHEGEPGWPSVVLRPGELFTSRTTWRFPRTLTPPEAAST